MEIFSVKREGEFEAYLRRIVELEECVGRKEAAGERGDVGVYYAEKDRFRQLTTVGLKPGIRVTVLGRGFH